MWDVLHEMSDSPGCGAVQHCAGAVDAALCSSIYCPLHASKSVNTVAVDDQHHRQLSSHKPVLPPHFAADSLLLKRASSEGWLNELPMAQLSDVVQGDVMGEKAGHESQHGITWFGTSAMWEKVQHADQIRGFIPENLARNLAALHSECMLHIAAYSWLLAHASGSTS